MVDVATAIRKSFCNTCRGETSHEVLISRESREEHVQDDHDWHYVVAWGSTWHFLECRGCQSVSLCEESWHSEVDDGPWFKYFPPRVSRAVPKWIDDLPGDLPALLNEIYAALHADSRRLATMGIRAAFDQFIVTKVGDQGTFADKLRALETGGHIASRDREIIEAALDLGSAASHRAHAPAADELSNLVDILESVLHRETLGPKAELLRRKTPPRLHVAKRSTPAE